MTFEKDGNLISVLTDSTGYKNRYSAALKKGYKFVSYSKSAPPDAKKVTAFQTGGYVKYFGPGGEVSGPGTGTSDSIPAMLSNGEYVVNAKSVEALGIPFMDNINKMAAGGLVMNYKMPAYSTGGRYKFENGGYAGSSNALYNITVNVDQPNASADEIAAAIQRAMRQREAMNGGSIRY